MKLTNSESIKIVKALPGGWVKTIHKEINEAITIRQIRNIINGETEDSYGIIDIAIRLAKEEKARMEKQKKIIKTL